MSELDERVRRFLAAGDIDAAVTQVLRALGPELLGFLRGVVGEIDAADVFSAVSMRLLRSFAAFDGHCAVRTWLYVLAGRELRRVRGEAKRHVDGRVPISELTSLLAVARTRAPTPAMSDRQRRLAALRAELPVDDRILLILRIDRELAWDQIALAFVDSPGRVSEADRKREAARLRKRFQLTKQRLVAQARALDLAML